MVQFIGGEPTLHADLEQLVDTALNRGMTVEVFSNLVHVPPSLWQTFSQRGVQLACSYYSDDPEQHAIITGRRTHALTKANITEALRRAIPLRVGVVDLSNEQRTVQATAELGALGVTDVGHDRLRGVGRGGVEALESLDELCGNCATGVLAISPSGEVWPCVFSRWLPVGNVRTSSLPEIVASQLVTDVRAQLLAHFQPVELPCVPKMCNPQCGPNCGPACAPQGTRHPCSPRGGCRPNYR